MIPRFQGKVGQATEPPEMIGKWFFTVWMSILGQGDEAKEFGPIGPWDTEDLAKQELEACVKLMVEEFEKLAGIQSTGEYVDLKTNLRRLWGDKFH